MKSTSVQKKLVDENALIKKKVEKIPLQKKLKANFLKYKIMNIHARENKNLSDNIFVRNKSPITATIDQLQHKISKTN